MCKESHVVKKKKALKPSVAPSFIQLSSSILLRVGSLTTGWRSFSSLHHVSCLCADCIKHIYTLTPLKGTQTTVKKNKSFSFFFFFKLNVNNQFWTSETAKVKLCSGNKIPVSFHTQSHATFGCELSSVHSPVAELFTIHASASHRCVTVFKIPPQLWYYIVVWKQLHSLRLVHCSHLMFAGSQI